MRNQNAEKSWTEKMIEFHDLCRKAGLKMTPQRLAVYKALIRTDIHPTTEEIYQEVRKEMPNVSLDTVNRTLLTLAEIGAAFIVEGTGQARRFDGGMEDHQHFRCIKCGRIIDFHYEPYDNIETPSSIGRCRVLRKTVYFEGYCEACNIDN
jgi:Fur family peroxide stress response transcriptional regulator